MAHETHAKTLPADLGAPAEMIFYQMHYSPWEWPDFSSLPFFSTYSQRLNYEI